MPYKDFQRAGCSCCSNCPINMCYLFKPNVRWRSFDLKRRNMETANTQQPLIQHRKWKGERLFPSSTNATFDPIPRFTFARFNEILPCMDRMEKCLSDFAKKGETHLPGTSLGPLQALGGFPASSLPYLRCRGSALLETTAISSSSWQSPPPAPDAPKCPGAPTRRPDVLSWKKSPGSRLFLCYRLCTNLWLLPPSET